VEQSYNDVKPICWINEDLSIESEDTLFITLHKPNNFKYFIMSQCISEYTYHYN